MSLLFDTKKTRQKKNTVPSDESITRLYVSQRPLFDFYRFSPQTRSLAEGVRNPNKTKAWHGNILRTDRPNCV